MVENSTADGTRVTGSLEMNVLILYSTPEMSFVSFGVFCLGTFHGCQQVSIGILFSLQCYHQLL